MEDWLSKYVDFKVLINLEDRTDRLEEVKKEFDKVGLVDVHHFPAIKHHIGISGCTRSHYEIIRLAKEEGYKNILILEDDVYFVDDKQSFKNKLESCFLQIEKNNIKPDMLYLGGYLTTQPDGWTPDGKFVGGTMRYHTKLDDNLYELGGCKTTHAYIIFESMYDKIINGLGNIDYDSVETWRGDGRKSIDFWYLSQVHHDGYTEHGDIEHREFKPYGIYPCLAGQKESFSDIQNRMGFTEMVNRWNQMLEDSND